MKINKIVSKKISGHRPADAEIRDRPQGGAHPRPP